MRSNEWRVSLCDRVSPQTYQALVHLVRTVRTVQIKQQLVDELTLAIDKACRHIVAYQASQMCRTDHSRQPRLVR